MAVVAKVIFRSIKKKKNLYISVFEYLLHTCIKHTLINVYLIWVDKQVCCFKNIFKFIILKIPFP